MSVSRSKRATLARSLNNAVKARIVLLPDPISAPPNRVSVSIGSTRRSAQREHCLLGSLERRAAAAATHSSPLSPTVSYFTA